MDTRKTIIDLLRSTGRKGIENVIELLENSNFFTVGSHSHHRYEGGTADHSLETLEFARRHGKGVDENSLIITSLLHDICYHMRKRDERPVRSRLELAVYDADKKSAKRHPARR